MPFAVTNPAALTSFAFGLLPLVIVISALSALLWYWRILPAVVGALAFVLRKTLGLGGAVGLGTGATIFLGMIEAPLLIRPCLPRMTRTELFILMTVGLASVAGTVFVLYASILANVVPGALGHILVASMMAMPGGVLMIPQGRNGWRIGCDIYDFGAEDRRYALHLIATRSHGWRHFRTSDGEYGWHLVAGQAECLPRGPSPQPPRWRRR